MNSTIYDISAGMMNEVQRQELIAANLAGANLAGFKGRHLIEPSFSDELQAAEQGVAVVEATDFHQGDLRSTGRSLDLALVGPGFFQVTTEGGEERLTRNGSFLVNADGVLTTQEGYVVEGHSGRIRFAPEDSLQRVQVSEDGAVYVRDGAQQQRLVGRLKLIGIDQPDQLDRISASYYLRPAELQTEAAQDARVLSGHLEDANITPVREMAAMIESLRKFEMGQKMLQMDSRLAQQEQQSLQA